MAGSTNFLQWNPSQSNQESDAAYAADPQRSGGATNDSVFPSPTANKAFYQMSTGITALMQMMATKGYTVNDTNIATLASVLSALLTEADIRAGLIGVTFASTTVCNASLATGFEIGLAGNTTISLTGAQVGDLITFILVQDSSGGHTITWPGNFFSVSQPDPLPGSTSTILVKVETNGNVVPAAPTTSLYGIVNVPIGVNAQSTGAFITPASSDNSTNAATTAWAKLGLTVSFGSSGFIKLPTWMGGLILQWAVGTSQSDSSVTQTVNFPISFPTACLTVMPGTTTSSFVDTEMGTFVMVSFTSAHAVVAMQRVPDHGFVAATPTVWAIGH